MDTTLYNQFPQWSKVYNEGHFLVGTDDLDSQASISILNQVFGYEQNCYATRQGFFMIDWNIKQHIGVDLALHGDRKCYDNHVTMSHWDSPVNPNSANINAILKISQDNYTKKCAFSTLLQVMSLLDVPLPPTDDGKRFLLSIDSAHLGYFNNYFRGTWLKYMELLGFHELIDIVKKENAYNDIQAVKIDEKLTFDNGILTFDSDRKARAEKHLGYELYLPQGQFKPRAMFYSAYTTKDDGRELLNNDMLFSVAMTSKKNISYSIYDSVLD